MTLKTRVNLFKHYNPDILTPFQNALSLIKVNSSTKEAAIQPWTDFSFLKRPQVRNIRSNKGLKTSMNRNLINHAFIFTHWKTVISLPANGTPYTVYT